MVPRNRIVRRPGVRGCVDRASAGASGRASAPLRLRRPARPASRRPVRPASRRIPRSFQSRGTICPERRGFQAQPRRSRQSRRPCRSRRSRRRFRSQTSMTRVASCRTAKVPGGLLDEIVPLAWNYPDSGSPGTPGRRRGPGIVARAAPDGARRRLRQPGATPRDRPTGRSAGGAASRSAQGCGRAWQSGGRRSP